MASRSGLLSPSPYERLYFAHILHYGVPKNSLKIRHSFWTKYKPTVLPYGNPTMFSIMYELDLHIRDAD